MASDQSSTQKTLLPRFGDGFLEDHARLIISDPRIALVELVANCSDAGADLVEIKWPNPAPDIFQIEDNGTGMTYDEFIERWLELNYSRKEAQGEEVFFPRGNQKSHRKAFGRNGKGRHSMFCFANEYVVQTWRDGKSNQFHVKRSHGIRNTPFEIIHEKSVNKAGHGTIISAELVRNHLSVEAVRELIGSKFIADPAFKVTVNGEVVALTDLYHLVDADTVTIPDLGDVLVRAIDSRKTGRTSKQHGVAWWVNNRLVGEPSWMGFDDDAYLDARTSEAKRFTFVVEADILIDEVKADWGGFKETEKFNAVANAVRQRVIKKLGELMHDIHKSRKIAALEENKGVIRDLPFQSRYQVGHFVDELQSRLPTIRQKQLSAVVEIMSNLEKSRSGYALLDQLANLKPHELDQLNSILESWSLNEIRIVMSELEWRLRLIEKLEQLVEDPSSDELHDIHPLFEHGLWIFGPEYESISFVSNKTLLKVLEKLFKDKPAIPLSTPKRRPDLIALPDSTVGIYSRDSFDERSEINGIEKILIVELKRGGFEITRKEKQQAQDYASELRKSGKVQRSTEITAFVLGAKLDEEARDDIREGYTTIIARPYSIVLRQAHARTFNLLEKIKKARLEQLSDPEVEMAIQTPDQATLSFASRVSGTLTVDDEI